jgi:bifunctional non-homologous end joining protein LigD
VATYSIRPKEGAPISMPVKWEEIYRDKLSSQEYNIFNSVEGIETIYLFFLEVL